MVGSTSAERWLHHEPVKGGGHRGVVVGEKIGAEGRFVYIEDPDGKVHRVPESEVEVDE